MKQIATLLFAAAIALASCAPRSTADSQVIYVSILPLRNIVEGIVGEDFPIEVLVPPGASPETFEPTPRQFSALNKAQLVFNVGLIDFEQALLTKVADPGKVVDLSRGIDLLEGSCSHAVVGKNEAQEQGGHEGHEGHEGHAHGVDPHVWTSPRALLQMARNAYEAISERYPDSLKYGVNYERLCSELRALDRRTAEKIAQSGVRYFIIYHPALTYYARDYGIEQLAIEQDGKEPSARRLAEIIRRARQDRVDKVFYQSQFPASVVEVVAQDIGARSVAIDPLGEQVVENIDAITDLIVGRQKAAASVQAVSEEAVTSEKAAASEKAASESNPKSVVRP